MQVDIAHRPQDLGYLFAITLLGSWSVLAANKVAEGREVDSTTRRIIQLVVGIALGLRRLGGAADESQMEGI